MYSLDAARGLLARTVGPLPSTSVLLASATGLRLAAAAAAEGDLPPADVSAMDGYAANTADLAAGGPLPVAFVVAAGASPPPLARGACARIFTGAVVPEGADTVVEQERAEVLPDGQVRLAATAPGSNVRRQGEIFSAGCAIASRGDLLTPQRLAALAAAGAAHVRAIPRPRVVLVLTGGELVGPETALARGQIRDSNGPMLSALCDEAHLPVASSERAGDELAALAACLSRAAADADLIVTSGGVSVGDFDLVPRAVAALGGETVLHKVALQPGKPVFVARLGKAWLAGLPGNPVSVLATWRFFARPIAEALAGDDHAFAEQPLTVPLTGPVENRGDRLQLRPGVLAAAASGPTVGVVPWKGSHDIAAAAAANCLVRLEVGAKLEAGTQVACYPLPWRLGA